MAVAAVARGPPASSHGGVSSSLQFDLEADHSHEDGPGGRPRDAPLSPAAAAELEERLAQLFGQQDSFATKLALDVRRLCRLLAAREGSVDAVVLATRLAHLGYAVTVRTALGGGSACFRNLRHEFLAVAAAGGPPPSPPSSPPPLTMGLLPPAALLGQQQHSSTSSSSSGGSSTSCSGSSTSGGSKQPLAASAYVVDPSFREQFVIPQPSPAYAALLARLPGEFVGPSARLVPLVQVLCAEMAASFEARGLTLPPWRRAAAMLSKWLPSRSRDVCVSGGSATSAVGGSSGSGSAAPAPESSLGVAGASAGCCSSNSEGASPTAAAAAAFSRISDASLAADGNLRRQGSGLRSLLSGKLAPSAAGGAAAAAAAAANNGGGDGLSRNSSGFGGPAAPPALGCGTPTTSAAPSAAAAAAAGPTSGLVRVQPATRGQPAIHKVRLMQHHHHQPPQQQQQLPQPHLARQQRC